MVVSIRTVAGKNAVAKGMGWVFGESDDDVAEARRMFSQKKKKYIYYICSGQGVQVHWQDEIDIHPAEQKAANGQKGALTSNSCPAITKWCFILLKL